jgi:hypothetical protein
LHVAGIAISFPQVRAGRMFAIVSYPVPCLKYAIGSPRV